MMSKVFVLFVRSSVRKNACCRKNKTSNKHQSQHSIDVKLVQWTIFHVKSLLTKWSSLDWPHSCLSGFFYLFIFILYFFMLAI